jgi:hypothetical protein
MLWTCWCLLLQSIIDGSLLADEVRVGQELVQLVVRQTEVLSEFLGAITSENSFKYNKYSISIKPIN